MDLPKLASVLRENGDQVLSGLSKLSLSTKLLKDLNDSFGLIIEEREALNSTFQVISASNSRIELLLDLQFLHDFIQRTVGLKLVKDNHETCDNVNITKFKNLKLLEIRKIPISQILGLQSLRTQLQYLVCVRSLHNLDELFVNCGGDNSQGFIWNELKEAVLSYNNLKTIDNSFEYVPWLQTLDLSHNCIQNAQAIDCLPNLKHLNLSFNHLEAVPLFKRELSRNLLVLILKSNYIEDLTGLLYLDNLNTLDLSCNCLVDHQSLGFLPQLAALQWLNLEGNPLSFHPQHRALTARYLHTNTASTSVKFVLDRLLLSKSECLLVGTYHTIPGRFVTQKRTHQSSVCSNLSDFTNNSEPTTISSELTRSQSMQRGRKVRDAVISETDENGDIRDDKGDIIDPELLKSVTSVTSLEFSTDHLETKKQIESLRERYGEEWLKSQSGSLVQDVLGMEKTTLPLSSTPYETDFMTHAAEMFENKSEVSPNIVVLDADPDKAEITSDTNATFVTASDSSVYEDRDLIVSESASVSSDEEQIEDSEEENVYLAEIHRTDSEPEEVFIVITDKYIKERDTCARIRSKWLLEVVLSCELIRTDPTTVRLEFDTVRRNMKEREYVLEKDEAQKLIRIISAITSERPLSAMNQAVYNCMKCSSQFSHDKDTTIISGSADLPKCPTCSSTLVYEIEEESTPTNRVLPPKNIFKSSERPESPSECSIASETESNPLAQIHVTAEVHMDYSVSTSTSLLANCSAASVQESNSPQLSEDSGLETVTKKYESDIEVISNPSQSSIEVLDDQFRPGRKRSSEERRTIVAPSLVTIPDVVVSSTTVAPLGGLTESSSSSSFTESVCTAYDIQTVHHSRPASGLDVTPSIQEEQQKHLDKNGPDKKDKNVEEKIKSEEKNKSSLITSIFEGLFSGVTTGTKSLTKSSTTTTETNDIQFTFSEDFSNIDHRVKFHLYQHIFEDEHEDFVWILRSSILSSSLAQPVAGCLVLSTHKVYILHINEHDNGQDLSAWLIKKDSYTIDRLQTVFSLPWKQGVGIEIRGVNNSITYHLCFLQDMQRTTNFLAFLAGNPLPDSCDVVCVAPERPMLNLQQLLLTSNSDSSKDASLGILSVFTKCTVTNSITNTLTMGVFLVTTCDLILVQDTEWLIPDSKKEPKIFTSQPVSNLLELDLEEITLDFHFLDEVAGCEEVWSIQWETVDSLNTIVSAVRSPWEEIFSVPLQVNHKVHSV